MSRDWLCSAVLILLPSEMNDKSTTASFWEQILSRAQFEHKCMACDRAIAEAQAKAVENYVSSTLRMLQEQC